MKNENESQCVIVCSNHRVRCAFEVPIGELNSPISGFLDDARAGCMQTFLLHVRPILALSSSKDLIR